MDKNDLPQLEIIYSLCKEKINIQIQQFNSLETKANTLIGFAGVVYAILISGIDKIVALEIAAQVLILIGVIFFAISVALSIYTSWIRQYRFYPDLAGLYNSYRNDETEKITDELIRSFINDWSNNNKTLEGKAKILRLSYVTQTCAFLLLAISLILLIL